MKEQASSVEYYHLVREFQEAVGARIDKIYQMGDYFLFALYTGERRVNLVIDVPSVAYLTEDKPSFSKPSGFCMFLRKRLQGGRITAVEQLRFDRILRICIDTKDGAYRVYAELFGKGNLIVCDDEDEIISVLDSVTYKDRKVRGGQEYSPPPPQPDVPRLSEEEFAEFFDGEEDAVIVLASSLGLGGEYAELLLERAGVDKEEVDPDTGVLYEELHALIEERSPEHTEEAAYPVRVVEGAQEAGSFSAAIAAVRDGLQEDAKEEERVEHKEEHKSRLEKRLENQQRQIGGYETSAVQNQRKGEALYERYQDVATLLHQARKDRKELSREEFIEKYEALEYVVSVDHETITVDFPEENG